MITTEKVTLEQRQNYEQQIEQLQQEKIDLKKELDTLRTVLKELHEQMSKNKRKDFLLRILFFVDNQEGMNNDRINTLQLKEDLVTKESSLFQAQSTVTTLRKELEQTREEVID